MCMIWHDVTKEPLPTNVDQILVRYNGVYPIFGIVTCYYHDDEISKIYEYWDDDTNFNEFGIDPYSDCRITHWSYIDPSGLPD